MSSKSFSFLADKQVRSANPMNRINLDRHHAEKRSLRAKMSSLPLCEAYKKVRTGEVRIRSCKDFKYRNAQLYLVKKF